MKKLIIIIILLYSANVMAYNAKQLENDILLLQKQIETENKRLQPIIDMHKNAKLHANKFIQYNIKLDYDTAVQYGFFVEKYAKKRNINPNLIVAIIITESHAKIRAKSNVGAVGLMQIYYDVWKNEIGISEEELYDPETNVRYGTKILKYYLDRYDGNVVDALMGYNTGSRDKINMNYINKVLNTYFKIK